MGVDAVRCPVIDRRQLQAALDRSPGQLDALQLLVAEDEVHGAQRVVVAVDHELAIQFRERIDVSPIDARACGATISMGACDNQVERRWLRTISSMCLATVKVGKN